MKSACRHLLTGLCLIFCNTLLAADDISDIDNYLQYGPYFSSSDLDAIWQPDKTWYRFIVDILSKHGLSQECVGCDWGSNEFKD